MAGPPLQSSFACLRVTSSSYILLEKSPKGGKPQQTTAIIHPYSRQNPRVAADLSMP